MTDELANKEREKYTKMWNIKSYRRVAPGEGYVDYAIEALRLSPPQSVIDFGTGTGRAANKFKQLGYDVTGIDHAANCLDSGVEIPLLICSLWDLPDILADVGYCTDVMEHIPEVKVDEVLLGIAKRVNDAFFVIDTKPDSMGRLIGETLHVTVKPGQWWKDKLDYLFDEVIMTVKPHSSVFVCKGSKK